MRSPIDPLPSKPSLPGLRRVLAPWTGKAWASVLLVLVSGLHFSMGNAGVQADSPQGGSDLRTLSNLVTRLRASPFRERLQAEAECREAGPLILPALTEALKSPDPELRRRAQLLIEQIEGDGIDDAIDAFLTPGSMTALPGWPLIEELVGDASAFRPAYGDMLRNNPQLIRALNHPHLIATELQRELQNLGINVGSIPRGMSIVDTSAIVLLLIQPDANYTDDLANQASRVLGPIANQRLNDSPSGQLLQILLSQWVITAKGGVAYQRLDIAMRLALPEAVVPALEMLKQKTNPHQLNNAFMALMRYGGAAEMSVVEGLLGDPYELNISRGPSDQLKASTQLRDLALATLIEMNHQDPLEFGLQPFLRNSSKDVSALVVSFENEAKRDAAFEKWQAWSGKHLRKYWPLPSLAEEGVRL